MISAETILKPNMEYYIDNGIQQFEPQFAKKYKLIKCKIPTTCTNLIIFGCYTNKIYKLLTKRISSKIPLITYIIWGGSDFNDKYKVTHYLTLLKNNKIHHLTISNTYKF